MKITSIMLLSIQLFILCALHSIVEAETINLNISSEYAQNENSYIVKVNFEIPNTYYTYAHEQIDSGKPTILKLVQNQIGTNRFDIRYPKGETRKDIFDPSKDILAYTGKTAIFVELSKNNALKEYDLLLEALLCSTAHCLPLSSKSKIIIPEVVENIADVSWLEQYNQSKISLNNQFTKVSTASTNSINILPNIPLAIIGLNATDDSSTGTSSKSTPLPTIALNSVALDQNSTAPNASAEAQANNTPTWKFTPQYFQSYLEVVSLGKAILLGLFAGLILNFMPCVLPVLTIKASALLLLKDEDVTVQYAKFREHCLLFAAGVITLFVVLAVLLSSAGLLWGQLFQKAPFVLIMISIVFALGLSMLGVFTLPMLDLKASSDSHPRLQSYTTGMLTTLLATPCSAPLLGGVLGWAFTQPSIIVVIVFVSVGLGMSLPYLLFSAKPQLIKYIPKPGNWIGILEKIVGFFLLATSLYLLSIMPENYYMPTLVLLLTMSLSAWIYGRFASYNASRKQRRLVSLSCVIMIAIMAYFSFGNMGGTSDWEEFNPSTFQEMLGKERILVEFTADWCPNCKLLEKTTLTSKNLKKWQKDHNLRLVRVDLSQENIAGQDLLKALGSHSIPLTAIFAKGELAEKPLVLRDIYTFKLLDDALDNAFTEEKE